jgi:tripartite motif-containing protein 71
MKISSRSGPRGIPVLLSATLFSLILGAFLLPPAVAWTLSQSEKAVEQQDPNLVLPTSQFGTGGSGPGQLLRPGSVVLGEEDRVWVCDTGNHRIQVFTLEGRFITGWGKEGSAPGEFLFPQGIALSPKGEVFVADTGNNRIQVFDPSGVFLREWGRAGVRAGEFSAPVRLAVFDKQVFVVERENHRVQSFSLDGESSFHIGGFGDEPGKFREPADVSVDEAGNLYVADSGNNRIQKFGPTGDLLLAWGAWGTPAGFFSAPTGLNCSGGKVYVCDSANHRIQVFDHSGGFLRQWGIAPAQGRDGQGHLHFPWAISIGRSRGYAVVCEPLEHRCQVFALGIAQKPVPTKDLPFWDSAHARLHGNMLPVVRDGAPPGESRWGRNPPVLSAILESESNSVLFFDISLRPCFLVTRAGGIGRRLGEFRGPNGIASDGTSGRFFVSDRGNRRLEILELTRDAGNRSGFAPNVRFIRAFDPVAMVSGDLKDYEGGRAFLEGLAQDAGGKLYVADGSNAAILNFDGEGRFIRAIRFPRGGSGRPHRLVGVALSPDGKRIYGVDQYGFQVSVFDADGTYRFSWGRHSSEGGDGFLSPRAIAVDQDGFVYVADSDLDLIKKFDSQGRWIAQWGGVPETGPLSSPQGIAFIAPDRIVVDDQGNHRGLVFTRKGEFLVAFYKGGKSSPSGR